MACTYCDADIYSKKSMSFEILAHMTKKALDIGDNIHFVWHGGEPLLLGCRFKSEYN
jgi:sulfatase maturation enzyme AslB (radical SAM superfamily)